MTTMYTTVATRVNASGVWEGVSRKVPPPLSKGGRAAYHARWANEYQRIAEMWKGRDRNQEKFYLVLKNRHRWPTRP